MANNLRYIDLFIIILPTICSLIISNICKIGNKSGENNNARPPSYIFGIVWTILYLFLGIGWMISRNKNKNILTDILYLSLILFLNLWIVAYGCFNNKKLALYIINFCILITLCIIFYNITNVSKFLQLPLYVWLSFAMLLNYTEVQTTN